MALISLSFMILILSKAELEHSTEEVMDWIEALGGSCVRFNGEDFDGTEAWHMEISDRKVHFTFNRHGRTYKSAEIRIVWFRRHHGLKNFEYLRPLKDLGTSIKNHLKNELFAAGEAAYHMLPHAQWFDVPQDTRINKIGQLLLAKSLGFDTPDTILTNSLEEIESFRSNYRAIITKSLSDSNDLNYKNKNYILYTLEVPREVREYVNNSIFPTLVQEALEKKYELRIFYLRGACYAMAIFSQNDAETATDMRQYNYSKPNRMVPFSLPDAVAQKIDALMRALRLQSGSVDVIITRDNRYVFLEVNPVGQFGMVSYPCNYNLEKKIAEYLVSKDASHEQEANEVL